MTMHDALCGPQRILMSLDAVGGVWRYALDLADGLQSRGKDIVFAGFGPQPSAGQAREAEAIGKLIWCEAPLDWMVESEAELEHVPQLIADLAAKEHVDLVHLNLPSQAAGLEIDLPIVAASHSCVSTWFQAVRHHPVPQEWSWQSRLNKQGFEHAGAVLCPSQSHAEQMLNVYGDIAGLAVVYNGSRVTPSRGPKRKFAFAAGRWWDDGKNGAVLDAAAAHLDWPLVLAGSNRGPGGQYLLLEHVEHRGEIGHAEAMAIMSKAAIVVSPSIYEPFGLAALEAARSGSALVLADIPIYRELWDGVALFAAPHDPKAFADAINQLSRDDRLREAMADLARERSQAFTIDAQVRAVSRIYRGLVSPALRELA